MLSFFKNIINNRPGSVIAEMAVTVNEVDIPLYEYEILDMLQTAFIIVYKNDVKLNNGFFWDYFNYIN